MLTLVFEVSPEKEVTGVQVWAVWRPVRSPTVLGWVAQSNDAAGEVLIENLKHIVGPVRESTILHGISRRNDDPRIDRKLNGSCDAALAYLGSFEPK